MPATNAPTVSRRPEAADLLFGAEAARTRPTETEVVIVRALAAAPDDPEVRIAAYRFYFYAHRHDAALAQARALLALCARRLNIPSDWRGVAAGDAAFADPGGAAGLYLQALVAMGYCRARLGARGEAEAILEQAARFDPADRFGGAWLRDRIRQAAADDD